MKNLLRKSTGETGNFVNDHDDRNDECDKLLDKLVCFDCFYLSLGFLFIEYRISAVAVNHFPQYLHHMLASLSVHLLPVAAVVAAFPSLLHF